MPIAALIPIRSFANGKARLSSILSERQRHTLGVEMARRTVSACEAAGLLPAVVSADRGVIEWGASTGLSLISESGKGLNQAAAQGVAWANQAGLDWVLVHSDLPLITHEDLQPLVEAIESGRDAIAPSTDGGTSAISTRGRLDFSYGPGSFHAHLPLLTRPVVVATTGLLHDLDSEADLASASEHELGGWLASVGR